MSYVIISIIILTGVYFSMRWVDGIDYMKDNYPDYKGHDLFDEDEDEQN